MYSTKPKKQYDRGKNICNQLNLSEEREQSKARLALPSRGKVLCKALKAVRRRIAEENGIPLKIEECTYNGECQGTCPRCEAEVRYLEDTLASKLKMGKAATVAGMALTLAACGGGGQQPQVQPSPAGSNPMNPQPVDALPDTAMSLVPMPEAPRMRLVDDLATTVGFMVVEDDTSATTSPEPQSESTAWIDTSDLTEGEIEDELIFGALIETEPEFPGGLEALYKFMSDNIVYPEQAREECIEGKVFVIFTVEKDGSVSNPRLLRDIGGGCGEEALRVVRMMPKWSPGKQQGKAVRTPYNIPVNFTLQQQGKQ